MTPVSASLGFSDDSIAFVRIAVLISVLAGATNVQAQQPGGWSMTGSLQRETGIPLHTATLLENDKVLVVGGIGAELYDPETGQWSSTGKLITPRYGHIAVRLADGKVLVAGGIAATAYALYTDRVLTSAEIYDPATGAWNPAGNLSVPREGHTANLLADGTVLVIGGKNYYPGGWVIHSSAEIYDPATGAWSSAGTMPSPHFSHASTLLANGDVLVIGGVSSGGIGIRGAELFNPATGTWRTTGNLITGRERPSATLLPNGKVLVAGGGGEVICDGVSGQLCAVDTAELYDPVTGQWSATGIMTDRRAEHTATLLSNGKVLVAGGHRGDVVYYPGEGGFYDPNFDAIVTVLHTAEVYDAATGEWSATGGMNAFRYGHTATPLANGKVLVAGGRVFGGSRNAAELYDAGVPLLTLNSATYCIGASWDLRVKSLAPNTWIRLAGTFDGKPWEILNWRKTDDNGNYSETGAFPPGSEGLYTLYVDVGGRISNEVSFSVTRCQIQLTLNSNEYCSPLESENHQRFPERMDDSLRNRKQHTLGNRQLRHAPLQEEQSASRFVRTPS